MQWSAEFDQIMLDFADGDLTVARGGEKCEWLQAASSTGNGLPDFRHIATGGGHDADTGDDWITLSH